jgi:hypothetical protein
MSAQGSLRGPTRRAFLGGAGMTVAAAVALTLKFPRALAAGADDGWHVDDICGHMPRYAHPIPYMHDTTAPDLRAFAAPVDWQFV